MRRLGVILAATCVALSVRAGFEVRESADGFSVSRNGRLLVSRIAADRGDIDESDVKASCVTRPDGSKVWNRWSEVKDRRFRLEVAQRADGAVEITLLGQMEAASPVRRRILNVELPDAALLDKPYACMSQEASYRRYAEDGGVFGRELKPFFTRFLTVDGVVFNFSPIGIGDYSGGAVRTDVGNELNRNGIIGMWMIERTPQGFRFSSGDEIKAPWGGYVGAKLILTEGGFQDYHKLHLLRSFAYSDATEPSHLVAFGSPLRGRRYAEGDVEYTSTRGYGWVPSSRFTRRWPKSGYKEGVYYSAMYGERPDRYRFANLTDGYYVFSFAAGNFFGADNRFSVAVNGETVLKDITVPAGKLRRYSRAIKVTGGKVEVDFQGSWLVSVLALQPVMAAAEDYSIARGIWLTDGYEPATLYRNADFAVKSVFHAVDLEETLPVPGTECAATPHLPPAPVARPDPEDPRLKWMKTAQMRRLSDNSMPMSEFDEPGVLDGLLDRLFAGKDVKAVMLSGMHSRHTYLEHHINRGVESMRHVCGILHRRGIKVIDHHDATLLWNEVAGFRVMMERLDETVLQLETGLPSHQFCVSNPKHRKTYYNYLRRLVEAGVDGFQIDELEFWRHGCICPHCRAAFQRDTGWQIPLNECDANWCDPKSELRKRWQDWRVKAITNWFVGLRRFVEDLRPDLVLSIYTTNDGFYYPYPNRNASSDVEDLGRVMNYFGTEMMTRSAMRNGRNLLPLAKMRTAVAPLDAAPVWTWYYNADYANEYFAWALSTLAGQIPLLSGVPVPADGAKFEEFGASPRAMNIDGAEKVAEIALLFPSFSRNWNEGKRYVYRTELMGTAQTLEALHVPYEFISDSTLASGKLDKYKVLYLGEAQCLDDAEIAAVRAFAERGGRVRLSVRAGTRDRFGFARPARSFPDAPNYSYFDEPKAAQFELDENWGSLVWNFNPDPVAEAAFKREIDAWTAGARSWRIEAPEKVFSAVWREKSGAYVVHLLNGTGVRMKPGDEVVPEAPDPAFPALRAAIVVSAPAACGSRAVAESPDFKESVPLKVEKSGNRLRVTLPAELLKTYTLIRLGAN